MRSTASLLIGAALAACSDASPAEPAHAAGGGGSAADGGGAAGPGTGAGGDGGSGGTGAGGDDGSGDTGAGGDDGSGGSPEDTVRLSLATPTECATQQIGPAPSEIGAIALGRFDAPAPMQVEEFRYRTCAGVAHEVVYFRSASAVPDESPAPLHVRPKPVVSDTEEETLVALRLDPPLVLDAEHPYGYFGVRMTEGMCVLTCKDSTQPDRNYWSERTEAPFGWEQLSQSPTPESGVPNDYVFSVLGRPL